MNAKGTSGTFSASPLPCCHLSRCFDADIGVPVAVWRSMDRQMHLSGVARAGLAISGHSHSAGMNHEGWRVLLAADQDPGTYRPTDELFTAERTALFGVMLTSKGDRCNSALNGTRTSGWGKGQNLDFQKTAPFIALRSEGPLEAAIARGIAEARRDRQIAKDMAADVPPAQIAYWMHDLAGIVLPDLVFSQQDRVGNIDFVPVWHWVENGELRIRHAALHGDDSPPAEGAIRIRRTHLNDNDAGGRVGYANFAMSTGMLEGLRHFPAGICRKLMALNADFEVGGSLHAYVRDSFGLDDRQFAQTVKNTALAAQIPSDSCRKGDPAFDVDPVAFIVNGAAPPANVTCSDD